MQANRKLVLEIIRRRKQRVAVQSGHVGASKPSLDPTPDQKPKNNWKTILGFAAGFGVLLVAAIGGATTRSR
jgi:hypothetical protein